MSVLPLDTLTGFNCVADESAEILILGSMPGVKSLEQRQYYAHPRNAFWKIIEALYHIPAESAYTDRLDLLKKHKVALWDVVHQCVRPGSLDSNIRSASVQVNDFNQLFEYSRNITKVFFNGKKAEELYKKHVLAVAPEALREMQYYQLPSTSPANASMTLEQKMQLWQQLCG